MAGLFKRRIIQYILPIQRLLLTGQELAIDLFL
jgi:hypothetical protein